jgi:hypothetical protein
VTIHAVDVVSVVAALLFVAGGAPKILGAGRVGGNWKHYGLPQAAWKGIGVCELLGALGLVAGIVVDARLGFAAAVCLLLLMLGAVRTHVKAREGMKETAPAIVAILLSGTVVALRGIEVFG